MWCQPLDSWLVGRMKPDQATIQLRKPPKKGIRDNGSKTVVVVAVVVVVVVFLVVVVVVVVVVFLVVVVVSTSCITHYYYYCSRLRPFVRDYPSEPVPEETFTHSPSWSPSNLYHLPPSTTIHIILPIQFTSSTIFLHNLSPSRLWSGALHLILRIFLYPINGFFSHHMHIPSQPVLL